MRNLWILLIIPASTGCKSVDCATGTIERGGHCEPADTTTGTAMCGPFTVLQGDKCVPMFPPTECDPSTTVPTVDPSTGVTTCVGNGGGGCSATFACPTPTTGAKQTICGQIYNLEDGTPFKVATATGAKCSAAATTGPCALAIKPYDAFAFAMNPSGATPLTNSGVYIDDCGRYRVTDIDVPSGPFIGLGFGDASNFFGTTGVTVPVGVATAKAGGSAIPDFEGFVVTAATTTMWSTSGGPALASGVYAPIYRAHKCGAATTGYTMCAGDPLVTQAGVMFTGGSPTPANKFYFAAAEVVRQTIDPTATMTGVNGTALIANATLADSLVYTGTNGISDTTNCQWETHGGASIPNIVFVQLFRPSNKLGHTCAE